MACVRLYASLGAKPENFIMFDKDGVLNRQRTDLDEMKQQFATTSKVTTLAEALKGADVFVGLIYFGVQNTANALIAGGATNLRANYLLPAFLPVVMVVCLFLAARGIYKDEKLIKSLDRLR